MNLPLTIAEHHARVAEAKAERERRIPLLRAKFDGAIRYDPMLTDHPEWTDEECLEFARKWHAVAQKQFKERGETGWNLGIPYCRNDITKANL
jgi:hypothetical protein